MRVVVVGDVMNDVVVRALGPEEAGSDTDSEIRHSPGGSGANQAAWLGVLGVPVGFHGRAGAADVEEHAAALRRCGVDARLAADPAVPTGTVVVLVAGDGERSMFTDRGANLRLCRDDLPGDLEGVALLHVSGYSLFGSPAREAVPELIADAVRRSVPVSCDPSSESYLRRIGPDRFLSLTAGVETLFPNAAEARLLAGGAGGAAGAGDEEIAAMLTAHYPTVVVKLGRRGALHATRRGPCVRVEAPGAPVVDTTGAGDAFCAGYLAAALKGESGVDAARSGLRAAAHAVGRMGARPAVPDPGADVSRC